MSSEVHITLDVEDHPKREWVASLQVVDKDEVRTYEGSYTFMEELIHSVFTDMVRSFPGQKIVIDTCYVKKNDDSGCFKPMLQEKFDKQHRDGIVH